MPWDKQMVEVNLNAPATPEQLAQQDFIGSISLRKGAQTVPYMDAGLADSDNDAASIATEQCEDNNNKQPYMRFFAVGPSTYRVNCPLCRQGAHTETVQMSGVLGQLSCLLSAFSCCFPIFSLGFVYVCLQSRLKSKRVFCNSCGGHLGFYLRPT